MVIYFLVCIFSIIILLQLYNSFKTVEGKKPNLKKAVKKATDKTVKGTSVAIKATGDGLEKGIEVTGDSFEKLGEILEDVFVMKQAKQLLCIFDLFPNGGTWEKPNIGRNC